MNDDAAQEQREPSPDVAAFPIIGIGASAGGIDALQRLFPAVPLDCDMAFVVVQHLDPDHKSVLAEVLARSSPLPVTQIEDETAVEAAHVYVIPPNSALTIHGRRLRLAQPTAPRGHRCPIDDFLTSLAKDQAENAACVILSGTGSDGTVGLRAIKENGGLTFAQAEAEYDGMMRSAVATGLVDFVLRAEEIPARLQDYFGHKTRLDREKGPDSLPLEAANHLARICALLRSQTGHDFSDYKDKTIVRRVQRRMHLLQIDELPTFIERLRKDPHEVTLLFQDLLIGVTNFFRDPEAFAALEHDVIPRLFEGKGPEDTVRVWVPGCATGEEAYSIAMLLREAMPRLPYSPKLQIFASDINEHAIDTARMGRYPATIAKDVPARLLDRYFLREDGTYRIASDLREICLFSLHNLLRDAPFAKLDLLSSRNLLIYLSGELQNRVIPLFHYALRPNGYLFLGTSENVTRHSRLFATVDKSHRIFQRRANAERRLPEFPLSAPDASQRKLPVQTSRPATESSLKSVAERQLVDRYAPAYVVINAEGEMLQSSGRTGKYLELPAGAPDTNIFSMARPGLRLDLRAAVHKAMGSGQTVVHTNVVVGTNGGRQEIDLYVQSLRYDGTPDALYMIVFQDRGGIKLVPESETPAAEEDVEGASVRQLELELRTVRERLQTTTEELESSNEELKSSNEELSSMNEELQSANEELETSKEELQSINEELQTVNAELNARVEELSRANNDMANLLESTQIATVFLDRALLVKSFTPAAKDVFRLVESDAGRPIMHVRARLDLDTLQEDAERVLRTLTTIEKPVVSSESNTLYVMRILPYRTADNVIDGVVLTFTDLTRIAAAEARIGELTEHLRTRVENLQTLLDLIPVGVLITEGGNGSDVLVNQYGARLLGAADGQKGLRPVPPRFRLFQGEEEMPTADQPLQKAARTGEPVTGFEGQLESAIGSSAEVMISATPLFNEHDAVRGAIAAIVNISQHKKAEAHQRLLVDELNHRVKNMLAVVLSLTTQTLRRSKTLDEFSGAFKGRIQAMTAAYALLSRESWSSVSLQDVVLEELKPYTARSGSNAVVKGPEVLVEPQKALALGMSIHELATNAVKYGALSVAEGHVSVTWNVEHDADGSRLVLDWVETNGPPVQASDRRGFGMTLIERSLAYELAGHATVEFAREGLRARLVASLGSGLPVQAAPAAGST